MIALVGQTVRDEIVHVDGSEEIRCGGAPIFAAQALTMAGVEAEVITRGGDAELQAHLGERGLPVTAGPASATFVSRLILRPDGLRDHELASLGTPFSADDFAGWAAPVLDRASTVVVGTQWRDDVSPLALSALTAHGRRVVYDAQGLARPGLGPVRPSGPYDPAWLAGVTAAKFSDEEAVALLGGTDAAACARAGVPIVTITYGEGGADVWSATTGQLHHVPADRIPRLADTVGAGDMFTALLAAALDAGADPIAATEQATRGVADVLRLRA